MVLDLVLKQTTVIIDCPDSDGGAYHAWAVIPGGRGRPPLEFEIYFFPICHQSFVTSAFRRACYHGHCHVLKTLLHTWFTLSLGRVYVNLTMLGRIV